MTRIEYIDFVINKLFELFPNLSDCLYSYDELSDTYFICVADKSVFDSEDFMIFSADTSLNYYDSGFSGTIAFISNTEGMEHLSFQKKKNTYLIKQDLIETFFSNTQMKNTGMTNPVFSTTPLIINLLLDISNPISNSFFDFSNEVFKNSIFQSVVQNGFRIVNSRILGNSVLLNAKSFIIEHEEDLIIALAA